MLAPTTPPPATRRALRQTIRRHALVLGLRSLWLPLFILTAMGATGWLTQNWPAAMVSACAGLAWIASLVAFWRAWQHFHPMDEHAAGLALERAAGLEELAPLTGRDDRRISGDDALWSWHQRQLIEAAGKLSTPVKPPLFWHDGVKALALAAALVLCLARPEAAGRALSFDLSPLVGDADLVVEVWAEPPAYTGLPLIRLDRLQPDVKLPAGSRVTARVDGPRGAPILKGPSGAARLSRLEGGSWQGSITISKSGSLTLDRLGTRAHWQVEALIDQKPVLTLTQPVRIDPRGRLDIAFQASDDYGLSDAFVRIRPVRVPEGLRGHEVFETPIALETGADADGARRVFVDVADHPLTGLDVTVEVGVRDGADQASLSQPQKLILPQRNWTNPLAAALQEIRLLILREARPFRRPLPRFATLFAPQDTGPVAIDVASLGPIRLDLTEPSIGAPPGIAEARAKLTAVSQTMAQMGLSDLGQLSLHYAVQLLSLARTVEDAHGVAPILWQMAVQIEASSQTPAQEKIAAARDALKQALEQGASPEEIQQLTQELREAVGERLQELAEQGASGQGGGSDPSGPSITAGDLEDQLKQLEESGSGGQRQDALTQLDQLDQLLENLQPGSPSAGSQADGSGQGSGLDRLMQEQRALSDETGDLANSPPSSNTDRNREDLANRQDGLADLLEGEPASGEAEGQNRQQAAQAMREAARALREGRPEEAQEAQTRALQALRQAAASAPQSQAGTGQDEDPIGRPLPQRDDGKATKVPDGVEKRRARDVRDELRRRQAEPDRSPQERDYIDRLLQDR
ncbi:DUF4175 family protein [Candidatus Phycosocius bacilliformis]|nr:DUF4175 family protein [Candidatus Phycosocius bacilliformis]